MQKDWPMLEARKILRREKSREVVLQTGFGASGVPHIGTIQEIIRTIWIAEAVRDLDPSREVKVIVFIDDLDGLRKVPQGFEGEGLEAWLDYPVSDIPFQGSSFSNKMVDHLLVTLEALNLSSEVEIQKASERYRSGSFNEGIVRFFENYQEIVEVGLSGVERSSWSPFMPICEGCGRVNRTRVRDVQLDRREISYNCLACGHEGVMTPFNGRAKLTWKADWALRWGVNEVSYEIFGKDLVDAHKVSSRMSRVVNGTSPNGMGYQLFVDEEGKKISKSKGNGLTLEDLLKWGTKEGLFSLIYKNPNKSIKLSRESLSQSTDVTIRDMARQEDREGTYLKYILRDDLFAEAPRFSLKVLNNIVELMSFTSISEAISFLEIERGISNLNEMELSMVESAVAGFRDNILPFRDYALSPENEPYLKELANFLTREVSDEEVVTEAFRLARLSGDVKGFFRSFYQILLGRAEGPRIPMLLQVYGRQGLRRSLITNIRQNSPVRAPSTREILKGKESVETNLESKLRRRGVESVDFTFPLLSKHLIRRGVKNPLKRSAGLFLMTSEGKEVRLAKVHSRRQGSYFIVIEATIDYLSGRVAVRRYVPFRSFKKALECLYSWPLQD